MQRAQRSPEPTYDPTGLKRTVSQQAMVADRVSQPQKGGEHEPRADGFVSAHW